ncbi:MAG: patatin family protein [Lachnospiraceae bacterium]|nr:patatin family protein [Lachnospiraceae bacterium]
MKTYKDIDKLPDGRADESITEGCLVLEGGAWKGLYTLGVLDALMEENINFRKTVGISAGALSGIGYVSGQIGWSARIDLTYRHDPEYCGYKAFGRDHGITGFSYLFHEILKEYPLDKKRLKTTERRLAVGATNMLTGETEYFEKVNCNFFRAVRASATVPYISRPVVIGGVPYLDGGCSVHIPYDWAKQQGDAAIMVVKTREREYRRESGKLRTARRLYRNYPNFVESMEKAEADFNTVTEELLADEAAGKIFLMAPSEEVTVSRFEGDMDKLGDLYWLGYHDMHDRMQELREYLKARS